MLAHTSTNMIIRCTQCDLPVGRVEGEELVLKLRHYGVKHIQRVNIRDLMKLAQIDKKGVYVRE